MNVFSRSLSTRRAKTAVGATPGAATVAGATATTTLGASVAVTAAAAAAAATTKVAVKERPKTTTETTTTAAAATTTTTKSTTSTHKRQSTKRLKMNVLQKADNTISSPATPSPGTPVLHHHHHQQQQQQQQQHYNNNNSSSSSSICGTPATPTHQSPQYHNQQQQQQHQQSGSISSGSSGNSSGNNCSGSTTAATPLTPCSAAAGSGGRAQVVYSSGHKNSLKGTKLARRARSFKDDLVEKFSLMRNTTNNTLGRSHSPHSPRNKHASSKAPPTAEEVAKSSQTLETHVKDISNALKHFRDVILKKKLEVLPGNGTVILETIASMYSVIQSYTLNEQSTVLLSATQQVYLSLGKLIKLCDEVMLSAEDSGECPSLSDANVREVVDLLEDAVRNLVTLAQQKLKEKDDCAFLYTRAALIGIGDGNAAGGGIAAGNAGIHRATTAMSAHHLMRPQLPEVAGQRTSLPDITLTPKERDILEKTKSNPIRASHSTESILRDTSPPPKPPLPNRTNNPPPLPPKRRSHPNQHQQQQHPHHQQQHPHHHHHQQQQQQQHAHHQQHSHQQQHSHHHQHPHHHQQQQQQQPSNNISIYSDLDCSSNFSLLNYGVDHLSVRSRSPDENSSQCSLDSALNHSREEEELKLLRSESRLDDNLIMPEDDVEKMFAISDTQNDAKTVITQTAKSATATASAITTATSTTTTTMTISTTVKAATDTVASDTDITSHNNHKDVTGNSNNNNNNNNNTITNTKASMALACAFAAGIQNVAVAASQVLSAGVDSCGGSSSANGSGSGSICKSSTAVDDASAVTATATANVVDCADGVSFSYGSGSGDSGVSGANSDGDNTEMRKVEMSSSADAAAVAAAAAATNNRHSNESGFVSMKSFRTSTQSVSKRSSDYSFQSSTKSSSSNSEIAFGLAQDTNVATVSATAATTTIATTTATAISSTSNSEFHYQQQQQQQQQQQIQSTTATATGATATSSSSTTTRQILTTSSNNSGLALNNEQFVTPEQLLSHLQQQQEQSHSDDVKGTAPPPALPPKLSRLGGRLSQYDNFDDIDDSSEMAELRHPLTSHALDASQLQQQQQQHHQQIYQWQSKHQSLIEPRSNINLAGSCTAISSTGVDRQSDEPPPLPKKTKHILAYMEVCSASTRSIEQHRHTMHSYNVTRNITHSQTMNIVPLTKELTPERETPPALPPKNYKPRKTASTPPTIITTPPPSPKPTHLSGDPYNDTAAGRGHGRVLSNSQPSGELMSTVCEEHSADILGEVDDASHGVSIEESGGNDDNALGEPGSSNSNISTDANSSAPVHFQSHHLPNETACGGGGGGGGVSPSSTGSSSNAVADITGAGSKSPLMRNKNATMNERTPICTPELANDEDEGIDVVLDNHKYRKEAHAATLIQLPNMLEEIDITPYLILKKDSEDGPEVKGGYIDALIVHASRVQKVADNAFSEAFITTFRTFIQPIDVIEKLTHRYTVFFCQVNDQKQKAAKETFSLLVRVVNDLTSTDLTSQLLTLLVEFVFQLVCSGQLYLAKLLRNKFVEKVTLYKDQKVQNFQADMFVTVTNQPSLLDLKSLEIAEQMTLLDAELFQKIEIPEVLLFAKEQCEEKSPNLNKFTEHFNKMSYWARSKILMLTDAKEREKHVIKFIKIMKHLRKMNNYNSYLALLSALDSAPIRRLEWHKTITEGLKEYCTLIDSSSSFRVYRQALAETNPPCIPYIGLVLQDLTFVHVGNQDYLTKGVINFSKRWQQYNIIVNMKRFKKCSYPFRRNERIIRFFENFENFLGEEEMWQISETIKPRGKRPANNY